MSDLTNQQLLDSVTGIVQQTENRLTERIDGVDKRLDGMDKRMATKTDLLKVQQRLERKISESQTINVRHHLATRDDIGYLIRQTTALREGLSHTAEPIQ